MLASELHGVLCRALVQCQATWELRKRGLVLSAEPVKQPWLLPGLCRLAVSFPRLSDFFYSRNKLCGMYLAGCDCVQTSQALC